MIPLSFGEIEAASFEHEFAGRNEIIHIGAELSVRDAPSRLHADVNGFVVRGIGIAIPEVLVERLQDVCPARLILLGNKSLIFRFHTAHLLMPPGTGGSRAPAVPPDHTRPHES